MKKKEIQKYFDKEWMDMKAGLKAYFKNEQQEDLHRFRVQVKKLRAFIILSNSMEHHPHLSGSFKPVRSIFKQAGEIRNAYMNQELGKAQHIHNNEFMSSQHQLQVKAGRKFKAEKVKFLEKLREAHRVLKTKIKPVSDHHISLFYENQLHQIAATLAKPKFNDQLHECRKRVKILIYNHKLAYKVLDPTFNVKYMEQVQAAIGDWHDHVVAIGMFSSDKAKDREAVIRLKKQERKLKKDITDLIKDFYNQATTVVETPVQQIS